jgi:hypothetical protein
MELGHQNKTLGYNPTSLLKTNLTKRTIVDLKFAKFNYENWLVKLGHENKTLQCIPQILLKHMNLKKLGLDLRFVKFNYNNWLVKLVHLSFLLANEFG